MKNITHLFFTAIIFNCFVLGQSVIEGNVSSASGEALVGAKARLEEIDFTEETRNLASLQILLQSSTAALAQANIIPQTLLQLLA